jgi:hypothetical protein
MFARQTGAYRLNFISGNINNNLTFFVFITLPLRIVSNTDKRCNELVIGWFMTMSG